MTIIAQPTGTAFRFEQKGSVILQRWMNERLRARSAAQQPQPAFGVPRAARRSFSAAEFSRLASDWRAGEVSINTLLEAGLPTMRARSRVAARSTEEGRRFLSLCRNNIVGPHGFMLQSTCGDWVRGQGGYVWQLDSMANAAIEEHWRRWIAKGGGCDITGRQSLTGMLRTLGEQIPRDGEGLLVIVRGKGAGNPYRIALQHITADRIDHHYRGIASNGNVVRMGVEIDSTGAPQAVYVLERDPKDAGSVDSQPTLRRRIPMRDVVHAFVSLEAEQLRGVPWAHAVMAGANMLHGFEESAVVAARVGASHMGFYVPPADEGAPDLEQLATDKTSEGDLLTDASPGQFERLPPGYDFKAFDPRYPSDAFDPFVKARKKAMAAGLDVAHHNLTGDMEGVNYSSARIAELSERDNWRGLQQWFIESICQPIAQTWLEMALLSGAITMPGGSALPAAKIDKFRAGLVFRGRGWAWVDPEKEVNAAAKALEEGLTTRTQIVAATGGDFEDNVIELAREAQLANTHGVAFGPRTATPAPPAPPRQETPT
ncbi:phage portal protein [Acidovorax lacteus]|uniref:Phage portal protein n=1 Tax=Acidovorax lacteus TaxID=1924988 RepID=A0ABP8KZN8_9BURK